MSGYGWEYFAHYKANYIEKLLPPHFSGRLLDFGCGVGNLLAILKEKLPQATLDGFDVSEKSLDLVGPDVKSNGQISNDFDQLGSNYDLIVVSNVFHHIPPPVRQGTVDNLRTKLKPSGQIAIFEHNPFNPLTQLSVHYSPLDRDAQLVFSRQLKRHLKKAGFQDIRCDYIVFFPKPFSLFHFLEPTLRWLPLGAQYTLVANKD